MYLRTSEGIGQPAGTSTPSRASNNPLDSRVRAIIAAVQDSGSPIHSRATRAVWYILYNYYRPEVGKISTVIFNEKEPGLNTQSIGQGANATGTIKVGRYFLERTTDKYFARRVLQVGHELQHIDQYRAGIIGDAKDVKLTGKIPSVKEPKDTKNAIEVKKQ